MFLLFAVKDWLHCGRLYLIWIRNNNILYQQKKNDWDKVFNFFNWTALDCISVLADVSERFYWKEYFFLLRVCPKNISLLNIFFHKLSISKMIGKFFVEMLSQQLNNFEKFLKPSKRNFPHSLSSKNNFFLTDVHSI